MNIAVITTRHALPCQRATSFGATLLRLSDGRLARPSPRSPYTSTPSGASPAQSASSERHAFRCGPESRRAWHVLALGSSSASSSLTTGEAASPPAPSAADSRRGASSRNTASWPRLRLGASDANRRRAVALRSLFVRIHRPRPEMWWRFCSPRPALSRLAAESLGGSSGSGGADAWRE